MAEVAQVLSQATAQEMDRFVCQNLVSRFSSETSVPFWILLNNGHALGVSQVERMSTGETIPFPKWIQPMIEFKALIGMLLVEEQRLVFLMTGIGEGVA
jgi:hypothetical protein